MSGPTRAALQRLRRSPSKARRAARLTSSPPKFGRKSKGGMKKRSVAVTPVRSVRSPVECEPAREGAAGSTPATAAAPGDTTAWLFVRSRPAGPAAALAVAQSGDGGLGCAGTAADAAVSCGGDDGVEDRHHWGASSRRSSGGTSRRRVNGEQADVGAFTVPPCPSLPPVLAGRGKGHNKKRAPRINTEKLPALPSPSSPPPSPPPSMAAGNPRSPVLRQLQSEDGSHKCRVHGCGAVFAKAATLKVHMQLHQATLELGLQGFML